MASHSNKSALMASVVAAAGVVSTLKGLSTSFAVAPAAQVSSGLELGSRVEGPERLQAPTSGASGLPSLAGLGAAAAGAACPPSAALRSAVLCCPIFDSNNEVIGVMQVSGKTDGSAFCEDDIQFLSSLGRQVSNALEGTGSILNRVHRALQAVPSGHLKEASPVLGNIWRPP
mmetsp:Transcript_12904/g.34139  ORF Transcript_12904/g.34139 Transcript_12904/m.34139 type:complete len:173 (+) Transcript_12904:77-595(+)